MQRFRRHLSRIVHGPAVDEPLKVGDGASRTWLHGDKRGSVVALADGGGTATQINTYGVWGEPGPTNTGRFGFTGQVRLGGSGLYHFNARAYSPILGRFLQTDPIGEQGGMNLYAYALNDPVNLIDPYGLQSGTIQLPPINVYAPPPINYGALNAMLQNTLAIAVPGYAASNSAMLNFQQGNYWASAGYGSLAVAELTLTGVTIGQYAAWSAVARGTVRGGMAVATTNATRQLALPTPSSVPNAGGVIRSFVQESDYIYYRVFTDTTRGAFLTKVKPRSAAFAQEALALPPQNTAAFIQEVLVPAGTRLQRSRALPAFGRQGGGEQFQLLNQIPSQNFGPGVLFR